jgi:hypothetical protein
MSDEPKNPDHNDSADNPAHSFAHFKWAAIIAVVVCVPIAVLWDLAAGIMLLIAALALIVALWDAELHAVYDD